MMSTRRSAFAISIHAPRTGSDNAFSPPDFDPLIISIHAPRTGSDAEQLARLRSSGFLFQSTLPARGATQLATELGNVETISIHAPRTGSDHFTSENS